MDTTERSVCGPQYVGPVGTSTTLDDSPDTTIPETHNLLCHFPRLSGSPSMETRGKMTNTSSKNTLRHSSHNHHPQTHTRLLQGSQHQSPLRTTSGDSAITNRITSFHLHQLAHQLHACAMCGIHDHRRFRYVERLWDLIVTVEHWSRALGKPSMSSSTRNTHSWWTCVRNNGRKLDVSHTKWLSPVFAVFLPKGAMGSLQGRCMQRSRRLQFFTSPIFPVGDEAVRSYLHVHEHAQWGATTSHCL